MLHVHFDHLRGDLDGEMRRIADFLEIVVPEELWPQVVERCSLETMREAGLAIEMIGMGFEGGAYSFFHQGTSRRWDGALSDCLSARIDDAFATVPADMAAWLQYGTTAAVTRP